MEDNSITGKITDTIFGPLKTWVENSNGNWSVLISVGFGLFVVGSALLLTLQLKMGKSDERTNHISLKFPLLSYM